MSNNPFFSHPAEKDAESLHINTIKTLSEAQHNPHTLQFLEKLFYYDSPRFNVNIFGLSFNNPLGVAAGFDKNALAVNALHALGFSFVEIGTIVPQPQLGNEPPRMFRLPEDKAIINRMGFNSPGVKEVMRNIHKIDRHSTIVGINIGANKTSVENNTATNDYVGLTKQLLPFADYLTINVSSPNTKNLRQLQEKKALLDLIKEIKKVAEKNKPILLKIAPDLTFHQLDDILDVISNTGIDGVIVSNTTVVRSNLKSIHKNEIGGLSGQPLRKKTTKLISYIYKQSNGRLPIIGAGGVFTGDDVWEKMTAGASLIQIYTGLVYQGVSLAKTIKQQLLTKLDNEGIKNITEIIGTST